MGDVFGRWGCGFSAASRLQMARNRGDELEFLTRVAERLEEPYAVEPPAGCRGVQVAVGYSG
eukprot:217912-Prymnesium_polylepis.2